MQPNNASRLPLPSCDGALQLLKSLVFSKASSIAAGVSKVSQFAAGFFQLLPHWLVYPKAGCSPSSAEIKREGMSKAGTIGAGISKAGTISAGMSKARITSASMHKAEIIGAGMHKAEIISAGMYKAEITWEGMHKAMIIGAGMYKAEITVEGVSKAKHVVQVRLLFYLRTKPLVNFVRF